MPIIITAFVTVFVGFWLFLMARADRDDWVAAAYAKVLDDLAEIAKLRAKSIRRQEKLASYKGSASVWLSLLLSGDSHRAVTKLKRETARLQSGDLRSLSLLTMPGYVLQRRHESIGKGGLHKAIMSKSFELYGKKHAANKTKHLLAKLLSYPIIGLSVTFVISAPLFVFTNARVGAGTLGVGSVLVMVLVYAMYDELSDTVKKRRAAITRQFPGVVSKLALLVTSGMIMDRAWKETAWSQGSELYLEMRKTAEELDNLVSPEAAYGSFISRCNTKETAKLASAIIQNLSKGNVEIGKLLKDMAREAWQERRHTAKRDAEKANSKLMIPTMMLFIAILVMLMVPIAMNFTGM